MLKLFRYIKKRDYFLFLGCIAFMAGNVYLELEIPAYMQKIMQAIVSPDSEIGLVWKTGGLMLILAICSAICAVIGNCFSALLATRLGRNLRRAVYEKVMGFSLAEIKHFSTASLITRTTNDVSQVQNLLSSGLSILVKAPLMAILALTKIVRANFEWTIATIVAVAFIVVTLAVIMLISIPKFKKVQTLIDGLNRVTREELTGARVVRAFNAEDYQEKKFEDVNERITKNHLSINYFMSLLDPALMLVMSGLPLAIYLLGASIISGLSPLAWAEKALVFANMTAFSTYAIQVVMSFVMLVFIFVMLPRAQVSARRINEVLDKKSSIVFPKENATPIKVGEVQFVNVGFKYPDAEEYVLHDINFKAEKGQVVAFIGSTGSGKSTLINLIPRLYDATEGQVIVDGVNVKDYPLEQLNSKIGYVAQKATLFSGTVQSNISLGKIEGKKAVESDIKDAIEISQSQFVYDLENGTDSAIDQGGKNVSGGQKQRLSIARALARKPEILIFDDSFSALDYKTDKKLRKALKKKAKGITCLIVAQRIGTILDADKILVLENGTVIAEGKHDELMKTCKVYEEIALSQLSKEELKNA